MQIKSRKVQFEDDSVIFETEEAEGYLFLHCNVKRWSAGSYKKMLKVFGRFINTHDQTMFTVTPNPKFAELFGGTRMGSYTVNNIEYEVVRWESKQQL